MASSSRDSSRAFGGDASTGVSLDVMFWMIESQSHEVAKTHAERGTKKTGKNNTGPCPARARGGLARGSKSPATQLRPRPRPRRGRRRGGARKSFGAVRARRHVGAARGLGRAAAPQGAQGLARLRRPAASKVLEVAHGACAEGAGRVDGVLVGARALRAICGRRFSCRWHATG